MEHHLASKYGVVLAVEGMQLKVPVTQASYSLVSLDTE